MIPVPRGGFLTGFDMTTVYGRDEGLMQLPVGGTHTDGSQECALVRLHSPVGTKTVAWTASSVGSPPRVPLPQDVDPDGVLLRQEVGLPVPGYDTSNNPIWR